MTCDDSIVGPGCGGAFSSVTISGTSFVVSARATP